MSLDIQRLLVAVAFNSGLAVFARWRKSVTLGGAVAGLVVGTGILYFGGLIAYGMLALFFLSSTIMSRLGKSRKSPLAAIHEKTDERDAVQVIANGGAGLVGSLLYAASGAEIFLFTVAGAFAAANADTWASELGVLSRIAPRSIVTRLPVPRGMSGGVTPAGTLASAGGGIVIGIWTGSWHPDHGVLLALLVGCVGTIGSALDSVLGATVQAVYRDPEGRLTERRADEGRLNGRVRGIAWVTNDAVNLMTTVASAVLGGVAAWLFLS